MIVSKAERENSSHHVDRSNGMAQTHIVIMDTTKIHNVVGTSFSISARFSEELDDADSIDGAAAAGTGAGATVKEQLL